MKCPECGEDNSFECEEGTVCMMCGYIISPHWTALLDDMENEEYPEDIPDVPLFKED